jgi:tape measure domain-containing protein
MNKEVTILMKLTDRVSAGFRNISKSFGDSVRNMQNSVAGAKKAISDYVRGMQEGSEKARAFADGLKTIAVASGIVAGGMLLVGKSVIGAAITMDSLKRGLTTVTGSAEATRARIKELEEVAKRPGLGLPEAIQADIRLRAVKFSAEQATNIMEQFSNAIASVGGGKTELESVIRAFTQMVGKGTISAEEVTQQLGEHLPQLNNMLQKVFGTTNIEAIRKTGISVSDFILKLTEGFSTLPRVIGGSQNALDNFNDATGKLRRSLGEVLLPAFTAILAKLEESVTWFNNLSSTTHSMITWAGVITGGIAALAAGLAGIVLLIPKVISGLAALKTAYLFLQSTQTLGLTAALGGATIAAVGLYVGLKKISDWYEKNAIKTQAVKLAEGLKPMTTQEEYEELGKTLDQQRQKLENLRKVQAELARMTPTTTYEALRPAAIEAEMQRIEAGIKQLESRRAKIAPIDKQNLIQFAQEVTKLADDIRKVEAKTAEIRAGLITDEQQRELELLRVRHEATIQEIDARIKTIEGGTQAELQLKQALNQQKIALDVQYEKERVDVTAKAAEKEAKEELKRWEDTHKIKVGLTDTYFKIHAAQLKQEEEAYKESHKIKVGLTDTYFKIHAAQLKQEEEAYKESHKIKVGLTETYFKIHQARWEQQKKSIEEIQHLDLDETIRDVIVGWKKLTDEEMPLSGWDEMILEIQDNFGGFVDEVKRGLESLGVEFDEVTESAFRFFEALASGNPLQIAGSGINFIAKMIDNMTGPGFGGFVIEWENLNQSIDNARTKITGLTKDLEIARGTRGMGAMAVAIEREIETLEKTIVILEGRLAGINFAEALRPGLESSWNELWQSLFDPDSVLDPLESFADTLDEMIFKQLVEVFTKTPELMEQARKLGEYIAWALNDGIISQTEKYEIDRYRALLVKEYETNTKKLMVAADALDLQIRQSRDAQKGAQDWMEFTKAGIFPEERGMAGIGLPDVLMKPQQTALAGFEAEEILASGKAPSISDVIEPKPGVTFVQNNQFSGLVNFDNPEAMRELARKLQPYTEELQENWVR